MLPKRFWKAGARMTLVRSFKSCSGGDLRLVEAHGQEAVKIMSAHPRAASSLCQGLNRLRDLRVVRGSVSRPRIHQPHR